MEAPRLTSLETSSFIKRFAFQSPSSPILPPKDRQSGISTRLYCVFHVVFGRKDTREDVNYRLEKNTKAASCGGVGSYSA